MLPINSLIFCLSLNEIDGDGRLFSYPYELKFREFLLRLYLRIILFVAAKGQAKTDTIDNRGGG